jgi:TatD family-associated radical SAM protein
VQGYDLLLTFEPTAEEVLAAVGDPARFREIVFCGLGEPTLRLDTLLTVASNLRERGARHIRLNTDGLANLVHGRDVTADLAQVLHSLSVSLTAQDEATYNRHTRPKRPGAYTAMLGFVRAARARGIDVTMTAIDGLEGVDIPACERLADRPRGPLPPPRPRRRRLTPGTPEPLGRLTPGVGPSQATGFIQKNPHLCSSGGLRGLISCPKSAQ